jgi:type I restriction enzyme, S subunit
MKAYESYKASAVDWIGEIPAHWHVKKLKYLGESIIGITYSPDEVVGEDRGTLVLRASNIQDGCLAFEDNVFIDKEIHPKLRTRSGDILICARNGSAHLVGKNALIMDEHEGLTFGAFMAVYRSPYGKLLYHFFNSQIFKAQTGLYSTSTINQLTSSTLDNTVIALPFDRDEQAAIADYLDQETARIDELVEKKKRLIELLKEERLSIINQAVTRGLDPNAKLKPSGIEWLGDIPEHWEVKKLKYVADLIEEADDGRTEFVVAVENIESETGRLINIGDYEGTVTSNKKFSAGDVLLNKLRPYLAKVYLAETEGAMNGELLILRAKNSLVKKFFFYRLLSPTFVDAVNALAKGTKMPRANWDCGIDQLPVAFPSVHEQERIANHIDNAATKIDQTIASVEAEIKLLNEYRTALISEVVTGKIKVC